MKATMPPTKMLEAGMTWPNMVKEVAAVLPPKASMALLMEPAMVLTWVMLPMPKAARAPSRLKRTASQFHFLPKPFLM